MLLAATVYFRWVSRYKAPTAEALRSAFWCAEFKYSETVNCFMLFCYSFLAHSEVSLELSVLITVLWSLYHDGQCFINQYCNICMKDWGLKALNLGSSLFSSVTGLIQRTIKDGNFTFDTDCLILVCFFSLFFSLFFFFFFFTISYCTICVIKGLKLHFGFNNFIL